MNDNFELFNQYAMNSENYKAWRKIHTNAFGKIFSEAFKENPEAQIHLTATLNIISRRDFKNAITRLQFLETISESDFDCAVVYYFTAMNYEMLEDEEKMDDYYEKLNNSSVTLSYPFAFHPYYRTAKLSQKASECSKALHYFKKALSFYDGIVPPDEAKLTVSLIMFDVATVYYYMHDYEECERFLELSKRYDKRENHQRIYLETLLNAVQGKNESVIINMKKLPPVLRNPCEQKVKTIYSKTDAHSFIIPQDRTKYDLFWEFMSKNKNELDQMISKDDLKKAEAQISAKLSETLSFMNRSLECKIRYNDSIITVICKNYCVKTLVNEYEYLFQKKPQALENWSFLSQRWFEQY